MTHPIMYQMLFCLVLPYSVMAQSLVSGSDTTVKEIQLESISVGGDKDMSSVIQKEQLANPQISADKILERIPGIQMIRRGNYAWEPALRSLNTAQINITLDGMHMFGACTDRMDPVSSYVESTNLSRIMTNFGPGFENYGGGIGGGIDFKLHEATTGNTKKISALIGSGYETNARGTQAFGSLQYSTKQFALAGNAIFRKATNYKAADGMVIPFSQYQKWNISLSATYNINTCHSISASYIQDEGRNIGYPALTMDVGYANAKIMSVTHHYHTHGKKLAHIKTKLYYNRISHAMDDTKRPPEQVLMHMDMPGQSWTAGFYSEMMYVPGQKHTIKARVSGYINRLTANMTMYPDNASPMYMYTIPDAQRIFVGLDLADYIPLSKRLSLNLSGNLSFVHSSLYSQSGRDQVSGILQGRTTRTNTLGNIGATWVWQAPKYWTFSAKTSFAARTASLQEYYAFYIYNRLDAFDYIGNARLRPEKSINAELKTVFDDKWFHIEISAFSYHFFDYIVGMVLPDYEVMTMGGNGVKKYINMKTATMFGGEAAFQIKFGQNLRLISTGTYTRGIDTDGFALPMVAPFQMINGLHANVKGYYAHIELETAMAQNKVSSERYGETSTPASTIVNMGVRKSYRIKKVEIMAALRVENLFDTYYYRHLDIMKVARPGRNIACSLALKL